jgi:hypothetical protein
MNTFWHQIELLSTAALGIFLAFIGDMVRLFHEQERGGKIVSIHAVPGSLLRAILMGVIAVSIASFLNTTYGVPELAGGGIGGGLGYLGPTVITMGFQRALGFFRKPKGPEEPKE